MQGEIESEEHKGLIPRAIAKVMECCENMKAEGWIYEMKVSFLEIYNEAVKDLLLSNSKSASSAPALTITRDSDGRTLVRGLNYQAVTSTEEIDDLMVIASKHRSVHSTQMNEHSSRSHSVFTLHLEGHNKSRGVTLKGALNLCDLAGSERVKKSMAEGDRLVEAASINKSLSVLSNVFMKIGSNSAHIPFRDSKLTYLLQDCLSGDGKTLMIVNLSPSTSSAQESLCSLRFASQVNKCELGKPTKVVMKSIEDGGAVNSNEAVTSTSMAVPVVAATEKESEVRTRSRSLARPPLSKPSGIRSHSSGR